MRAATAGKAGGTDIGARLLLESMKVRSALRKMCGGCRVVKRGKKVLIVCKENPKHKQRQGFATMAADAARPAAVAAQGLYFGPPIGAAAGANDLVRSVFGIAAAGDDSLAEAGDEDEDGGT
ncbi:hypothetical protein FNF29_01709 [Cafeteria roenbergensis]|uniref:Ribosomal protein n=1 Tax=Cafeteria roenbergensis TaxID=33653 RepID=A0A5A8DMG6_CAFRO|nr:hypothetical protein FNF29_01709 [Cafeteria roenbergensis]KAA0166623.1 hypothetical protein FNF31_01401 [Cafeteria roenbergensis]KAA0170346.1 hypothetical protein FNF28_01573 [Cafeteria roenbergensis]|eukprot:KAA0155334.1 hypothetical protein FNF29_01709 [Cafeteria roenbergensis]